MFNIGLFGLFSLLYAARWFFFFDGARRIFDHPAASMFFGCIPMGLATIVNGFLVFGVPLLGERTLAIAHGLWLANVAMSLACGLVIPFLMFTRQDHSLPKMSAIWLSPVVAAEVAAASVGLLAPHLSATWRRRAGWRWGRSDGRARPSAARHLRPTRFSRRSGCPPSAC
jgi:tellurite resistance protein TehA-like permease